MEDVLGVIAGLLGLGLVLGIIAATSPSMAERTDWQTETLSANKTTITQASIEYLQNQGYPIKQIDREAGFISTRYASSEQLHGVAAGLLLEALSGEKRFKATITILPENGGRYRVRVKLIAESRQMFHWSTESSTYYGESDYKEFFSGLKSKVREIQG